jgi:hypothetical protein
MKYLNYQESNILANKDDKIWTNKIPLLFLRDYRQMDKNALQFEMLRHTEPRPRYTKMLRHSGSKTLT